METNNLQRLTKVLTDTLTKDEFVKSFQSVVTYLQKFETSLTADFKTLVATLTKKVDDRLATVKDGLNGKDGKDGAKGAKGDQGDRGKDGDSIVGPAGNDGRDGSPDTAEDIRNKLELLDGDERLDAKYIKNLPTPKPQADTRVLGGHGPLYALSDVDVVGITIGQSIKWDGIRWIPFTPAGTATTPVYEEVPTDSGDHITFTLTHSPATNTLRLYCGGARQQEGTDYTLAGDTITLSVALQSGETLMGDYEY